MAYDCVRMSVNSDVSPTMNLFISQGFPIGMAILTVSHRPVIDGADQRAFFEGKQPNSNRDGFLYWMGDTLFGVKWRNFKMVLVMQRTLSDPALHLTTPHLINLDTDPKEREPYDYPHIHTWVGAHTARLLMEYQKSLGREPLIPVGAPLDYVPRQKASLSAA